MTSLQTPPANFFGDGQLFPDDVSIKAVASKKKLSKDETKTLQEQLFSAISSKDAASAQAVFDAGLPCMSRLRQTNTTFLLVQSFSADVAAVLTAAGLSVQVTNEVAVTAARQETSEAARWLMDNHADQTKSHYSEMVQAATHTRNVPVLTDLLSYWSWDIPPYYMADIMKLANDRSSEPLLRTVIKKAQHHDAKNKSTDGMLLNHWLQFYSKNVSYANCLLLQKVVSETPESRTWWDKNFPKNFSAAALNGHYSSRPKHKIDLKSVQIKTFLQLLVIQGADCLTTLARSPVGASAIEKALKSPSVMGGYISKASATNRQALFLTLKDNLASWRDTEGRNIGHYMMLSGKVTKSLCDDIYQICPEWLSSTNTSGKTPMDFIDIPEVQAYIGNRLLKRTLNDNGTGLIRKKTATTKRRM